MTAKVADLLADAVGADIHEIQPKVPYTKADLNWMDKNSRSSVEMNNKAYRPEIAESNIQIDDYDVIFLAGDLTFGCVVQQGRFFLRKGSGSSSYPHMSWGQQKVTEIGFNC